MTVILRFFLCLALSLAWSANALASSIEKLVMPGQLIQGHAKYENDCNQCHERFSKTSQRRLCLECHKEAAEDIRLQKGYHGRNSTIRTVECKQCHSDHLGRGADIVQLNKDLFDHSATDYPLRGLHAKAGCALCHKPNVPWRKAPSDCYACHKPQDVHQEKLGRDCGKCHGEEGWRKTLFNHDKTAYPLTGRHKEVTCALCHPEQRYKPVPHQCIDCHSMNDVHAGRYGASCQKCHSTREWKSSAFDHDKETKFLLRGRHKAARCSACHKTDYKVKLGSQCRDCHDAQDIHKGLYGKQCGDCHGEQAWREHSFEHKKFSAPCAVCHKHDDAHQGRYGQKCADCHVVKSWREESFNHDRKTRFPLRGKHRDVRCQLCHAGDAAQERDKTQCHQCHASDDVHKGKQGKQCQGCHSEQSWREKIAFDHDLARFPLVGMHAVTACEGCHLSAEYKGLKMDCRACHAQSDEHKGRLGSKCELCHNPNSWKFWQYDHDQQTKFKLEGAHLGLACDACHQTPVEGRATLHKDCQSCHGVDDTHGGRFGRDCERCHNTRSFKEITIRP